MLELTRAGLAIRTATPMGYCDHFGLRRFAEDDALGDRLADSLKTGGGTLAVSWLNLGEYANVTSRETRVQVERLGHDHHRIFVVMKPEFLDFILFRNNGISVPRRSPS